MSVPVLIVTGFLGCGKTSFLRHLLPLCGEAGKRPALIINEVGDVDVDGELLADLHAEQVRLVGGCVCCTLQSQLSGTIWDILEKELYDLIIIECSGLSNPMDVVGALSSPALVREIAVSHIICLLDSGRCEKILQIADVAKAQVSAADVVVFNKADTVPLENRESAEQSARELMEHANTYWTTYGNIGTDNLHKLITDDAPTHCACGCNHDHHHAHHNHSHSLPASFCTVALQLPEKVDEIALHTMMAALPTNVIRAKGFANVDTGGWQILHKVYDDIAITPLKGPDPSSGAVLICIGQHLSSEDINTAVSNALQEVNV
ncbi:GTP-binding protein [bacterium]|nr:GTP-binding protein [bacterium]